MSWRIDWTDSYAWCVVGLLLAQGFAQDGSTRFSGTGWSGNTEKPEKRFWQVPPPSKEKSSTRVVRHSIPQNRISIILLLNGCAAVTILGADPFNSILKMEMNIRLKQNLGKLFVWRKFFNLKGKQKWGHQILLDKLSSTRTLLIIDTMAPRSHGPSRWRSP